MKQRVEKNKKMKLSQNFGAVLRTLFVYLPVLLFSTYHLLLYLQSTELALVRLESKLKPMMAGTSGQDFAAPAADIVDTVVLGLVCCGSGHVRISELSVVIKSAILFSETPLKFVIFADKLKTDIVRMLTRWRESGKYVHFDWDIREPSYPEVNLSSNTNMT